MIGLDNFVNRKNINHFKQNRPTLIARDFELLGINKDIAYNILLSRGVFKWLAVREDLIKLKDSMKEDIKDTLYQIKIAKEMKQHYKLHELRGRLKALELVRKAIRLLCHSSRFRAPNSDLDAQKFLSRLIAKEKR